MYVLWCHIKFLYDLFLYYSVVLITHYMRIDVGSLPSEICNTFKHNGITDETIRLKLFLFSLRDKDMICLHSLPVGTITTWEDLTKKILAKFFHLQK